MQKVVKDYKYEGLDVSSQKTLAWPRTPSRTTVVRLESISQENKGTQEEAKWKLHTGHLKTIRKNNV